MGKPEVVLTLAGDSADLEKAMAASAAAAEKLAASVEASSKAIGADFGKAGADAKQKLAPGLNDAEQAAQKLGVQLDRTGAEAKAVGSDFDEAARRAREAESGFDRIGERFDQVDTRAMGARDAVTGVQDSMGSLAALAKGDLQSGLLLAGSGLSDLGSAGYNSVIPMAKDLVARFGLVKLAMLGVTGLAVAGAGALLLWARSANKFEVDLSHAQEDLERFVRTGRQTETLRSISQATGEWGKQLQFVDKSWKSVLSETSQFGASGLFSKDTWNVLIGKSDGARQHIEAVDKSVAEYIDSTGDLNGALQILASSGLTEAQIETAKQKGQLDEYQAAANRARERTWDLDRSVEQVAADYATAHKQLDLFNDALSAAADPVIRFRQAQVGLADAQKDYNDAVKEHGKDSREAEDASWALVAANTELLSATTDLGKVDLTFLEDMYRDGLINVETFEQLAAKFREGKAEADKLNGTKVLVDLQYKAVITNAALVERYTSGYYEQYGLHLAAQVPHMAEGGIVTRPTLALIGEAGPEAVVPLGRGGGTNVTINTGGSAYVQALMQDVARGLNQVGGLQVVVR